MSSSQDLAHTLKRKRSSITYTSRSRGLEAHSARGLTLLSLVKTEAGEAASTTTTTSSGVLNGEIVKGLSTARSMSLVWQSPPHVIAMIKRRNDQLVRDKLISLGRWLMATYGCTIMVEPAVHADIGEFSTWDDGNRSELHASIDLIICMGGDGTFLHVSSLFHKAHPPVLAFNFGSLGFLTPFDYDCFRDDIPKIFTNSHVTLRSRLHCTVHHVNPATVSRPLHVLNEIVVDRGQSPYLSQIDCYCNDSYITTVQADGLIVATATGSTAYSVSAGGSIMHPEVPGILFTPICPHSLSFRPIIFPDSVTLRLQIPSTFNGSARITGDGQENGPVLMPGDSVSIVISKYPVPCLTLPEAHVAWMRALADCLHWNARVTQRGVPVAPTTTDESISRSSHSIMRASRSAVDLLKQREEGDDSDEQAPQ
jgi:NAD+ kinase